MIHRNNLDIRDAAASPGPVRLIRFLSCNCCCCTSRLRIDQGQLADRDLVFRGGDVELRKRAQIESSLAFVEESLRGIEGVLFGLQIVVVADQRIVGIQHVHDDARDLRLEVQVRHLQVHLRDGDISRIELDAQALQKILLDAERERGRDRRVQNVEGRIFVEIVVAVVDRHRAAGQQSPADSVPGISARALHQIRVLLRMVSGWGLLR